MVKNKGNHSFNWTIICYFACYFLWDMRIVIAGAGEVGTHLAKMLSSEEHDLVVIDNDVDRLKAVSIAIDGLTIV